MILDRLDGGRDELARLDGIAAVVCHGGQYAPDFWRFHSRSGIEVILGLVRLTRDLAWAVGRLNKAFEALAFEGCRAHSYSMDNDLLTVRTRQHGAGYAWELYRASRQAPVKFSVPIYGSEEAARSAGADALRIHLGALEKKRRWPNR